VTSGSVAIHRVATAAEAASVLEYFNGFHDGFIKRLMLVSHDYFEARGVQVCSGDLELEITLAHYNYREGEPPADQLVRARFTGVRDIRADLGRQAAEWSLMAVHFDPGSRRIEGADQPCLVARFLQQRLVDERWEPYEALGFTFTYADLREVQVT